MMLTFKGRWTARVEQDFEIEAESEKEAREYLAQEMSPRNVVELMDFDVLEFEEVKARGFIDGETLSFTIHAPGRAEIYRQAELTARDYFGEAAAVRVNSVMPLRTLGGKTILYIADCEAWLPATP